VAELLRNLASNSAWLEKPDLTEVRAATLAQSKTGKKVVEFTLAVSIKRQRDKDAALAGKPVDAALKSATPPGAQPASGSKS
jgi:type IV pilus assembly protein PilN